MANAKLVRRVESTPRWKDGLRSQSHAGEPYTVILVPEQRIDAMFQAAYRIVEIGQPAAYRFLNEWLSDVDDMPREERERE